MSNKSLVLRAYGRTVRVLGSDELLELTRELLPAGYRHATGPAERSWSVEEDKSGWRTVVEGKELSFHKDAVWAIEAMVSDLELWIAEQARGHVFVHAGCAATERRAIVLPGWSLSGKTHLTSALVRAGGAYYSDEFAVLDRHGSVRPYPRPLATRNTFGEGSSGRISVEQLHGRAGRGPAQVALVAILRYDPAADWAVEPLTRSKAILELMAHTVPAQSAPRRSLHALENATAHAIAIKGTRGDADEAAARLLEILSTQAH